MAFLVASPLINPALFLMTMGALGIQTAVTRTVSAFVLGIVAGFARHAPFGGRDFSVLVRPGVAGLARAGTHGGREAPGRIKTEVLAFLDDYRRLVAFIGKFFLLALVVAGLVQALIPSRWIVSLVGPQSGFCVLIAVAMGVPLYACGGGTIPVVQVLTQMGMSQGAALASSYPGRPRSSPPL